MATLCKTFPSTESALHAAEALSGAGVPVDDIGVLVGHHNDDVRTGGVGDFGGPIEPDDDSARRLLTCAHVPDDVARRMVRHLHEGEAIIFVQLAHVDLGTAEALIGQRTVAA